MSEADIRGTATSGENEAAGQMRDQRIRAIRGSTGTADPSDQPAFSQPVRQVVMMLIVLGLVIAGGWFAYGRILSVFDANPYLNGLILVVFALGVVTCFWQVGQLINSVNWIERFAARRRNALQNGVPVGYEGEALDAPRLLAPLAALLGARGPVGRVISTASSRSILDSVAARIDEARDITRYLSNLLIFLGLLGTFYGLATTVPAVVDTIRALNPQEGESGLQIFDKLMTGLEGQLGGMATAFSSSLLGLAGSLVVGLLELFATHGQNRFYRELEEWMSGFTRVGLTGADGESLDQATVASFLDQITGQMADLHEYYLTRDASREAESAASEARMLAMTQGVETLAAQILEQSRASAQDASEGRAALARFAEGSERLAGAQVAALDAGRAENGQAAAALARLAEGQDQLIGQIQSGMAASLSEAQGAGAALARMAEGQMRLAGTIEDRLAAPAPQSGADQALLARLAEGQEQLAGQLLARIEGARRDSDVAAQALAQLVEGQGRLIALAAPQAAPSSDQTAGFAEGPLYESQMHLRSIDNQLARLSEEMASTRADLIGDLREDMAALTRAIRRLGQGDEA